MKRLLGLLGLTFLVVLTACFYLGTFVATILSVAAIVLFAISLCIKKIRNKKTLPVLFLTALVTVSLFMGYTHLYVNPIRDSYDNKTVPVKAVQISDGYYSYGYYCYELRCTEVDGKDADCKMLLRSKDALYSDVCDTLEFTAELNFGSDNIAPSEKIFLQSWISRGHDVRVTKADTKNLAYHISAVRRELNKALYLEMEYDTANFSSAVLLGNKYALEPQVKALLRTTGLSHISVVSGLHLSVIGTLLIKLFSSLLKNRYVVSSFSIVGTVIFAVLAGLGVSVVRALIMFVIYTVGTMLGRRSDSVNSIGAAALVLTLPNPYAVGDVGMLLSFSATLGIVLWYPKVFHKIIKKVEEVPLFTRFSFIYKFIKGLIGTFSCTLCATLWTIPISIFVFKGFSLVSLIANLFVVPFMLAILLCIVFCVLSHYVVFLSVLTDVLSRIVSLFYDYLILMCRRLSDLPFAYIHTTKSYFFVWIAASIILVLLAYIVRKRFMNVFSVLLSVLMLFSFSSVYRFTHRHILTFHVPFTGSGVSVLLESNDGYAVLGANGSASRIHRVSSVAESIHSLGNNVLVSLPGYNSEKYSENLVNEFDYGTILRYDNIGAQNTEPICDKEVLFTDKHYLNLWDKAEVTLIPCKDKVFVYVKAGDKTLLIVPRYSDCSLLSDEYRCADTVVSQGNVVNPKLLEFNTLIAPGEGFYDDESMGYLLSVSKNTIRGNDITYDIDIR